MNIGGLNGRSLREKGRDSFPGVSPGQNSPKLKSNSCRTCGEKFAVRERDRVDDFMKVRFVKRASRGFCTRGLDIAEALGEERKRGGGG